MLTLQIRCKKETFLYHKFLASSSKPVKLLLSSRIKIFCCLESILISVFSLDFQCSACLESGILSDYGVLTFFKYRPSIALSLAYLMSPI